MFLTQDELKTVATAQIIDKIIAGDTDIVATIIAESISLMAGYLSKRYDTVAIFAAEGADRHLTVLKRLKDIAIYEIYERHTREQNAVAMRRYNEAMAWLEKLNTGEFYDATMPPKPVADPAAPLGTDGEDTRFGGYQRYTNNY